METYKGTKPGSRVTMKLSLYRRDPTLSGESFLCVWNCLWTEELWPSVFSSNCVSRCFSRSHNACDPTVLIWFSICLKYQEIWNFLIFETKKDSYFYKGERKCLWSRCLNVKNFLFFPPSLFLHRQLTKENTLKNSI